MSIIFKYTPEKRIIVDCVCCDGTLEALQYLIKNCTIATESYTKATLRYNAYHGNGIPGTDEFYPLKFSSNNCEVWISNVTTGHHGIGAQTTVAALKLMGFNLPHDMEASIFDKKIINETFVK